MKYETIAPRKQKKVQEQKAVSKLVVHKHWNCEVAELSFELQISLPVETNMSLENVSRTVLSDILKFSLFQSFIHSFILFCGHLVSFAEFSFILGKLFRLF